MLKLFYFGEDVRWPIGVKCNVMYLSHICTLTFSQMREIENGVTQCEKNLSFVCRRKKMVRQLEA